jgi:flavin reductase (DIM6/NTAB) family NADH-FMN oxidoreductase RutF
VSAGVHPDQVRGLVDPGALRAAFGAFATGVTIITTRQVDGTPRGFTANSFTSVSLDPPLLLVCVAKSAHSCQTFMTAPHFAVNVLAEDQKAVSGLFASRERGKFAQCEWVPGVGEVPLIEGALAHFSCSREQSVDAGDHIVLIGRVIEVHSVKGNPLGYFRGRYFSIGIENDLVQAAANLAGTRVGAVLASAAAVLMEDRDGHLNLPLSPGPRPTIEALESRLRALGLSPETDFLYAVFDDRARGGHGIYYHGKVAGRLPDGFRMVALGDLAAAPIANEAEAQMLLRYAEEYRHGTFGIYQGNETTGAVRRVGGA